MTSKNTKDDDLRGQMDAIVKAFESLQPKHLDERHGELTRRLEKLETKVDDLNNYKYMLVGMGVLIVFLITNGIISGFLSISLKH